MGLPSATARLMIEQMGGDKAADRIGSIVARSYRLVGVLGEGGMGTVYEAEHTRVPRKFAVKVLKADCANDRQMFDRFRREAEIASSIGHEHIVDALDFDVLEDGAPYIILEHLEGEDLGAHIQRRRRLTVDETIEIMEDTASALHAAHEKGIVHRDLKPQNLFLIRRGKRDNFVKVLDFGISKVLHDPALATREGVYLGTPNYMAPEQLSIEHGETDRRADVWALAAIAYECLAGRIAFAGPTVSGTLYQVVHGEPLPLRTFAPGVPEAVAKVIARGLAKRPDDRFGSAKELSDALLIAVGRAPSVGRMPTLALGLTPPPDAPVDALSFEPTLVEGLPPAPARHDDTLQATSGISADPIKLKSRVPLVAALLVGVAALVFGVLLSRGTPTTASAIPSATLPPTPTVESQGPQTAAPVQATASTSSIASAPPNATNALAVAGAPSVNTKATKPPAAKSAPLPAVSAPTKATTGGIDIGPREKDL